jgi:hypothetical protein
MFCYSLPGGLRLAGSAPRAAPRKKAKSIGVAIKETSPLLARVTQRKTLKDILRQRLATRSSPLHNSGQVKRL